MKKPWQLIGQTIFWLGWPLLWLSLGRSRRTRVIIMSAKGNILLEKGWIGSNEWILPGGGLHRQEEPDAGAVREVYEETGISLEPDQLEIISQTRVSEYGLSFDCWLFAAALPDEPIIKRQVWELTEISWLPLSHSKNISPLTKRLLAKWNKS